VHPIPAVIDRDLQALQRRAARAYVTDVITNIVNGHPNSRIDELLPWVYPGMPDQATPATQELKAVA
jgi:hypothetical protein